MRRFRPQVRIEFHLRYAFTVAQIDKNNAAVVADGIDPADEGNGSVKVGWGELGAMMGAFHKAD
jgi:hypothetical protein